MAEKKRCMCQLCGPTVHIKLCDNCRGKHSWWKAISQIILATIRECGGVKWRFHMQMCRWEGSGTLPNSYDPHSPAFGLLHMGQKKKKKAHKETASPSWEGAKSTGLSQASIMWNPNNSSTLLVYGKKLLRAVHLSEATAGIRFWDHANKANNPAFLRTSTAQHHQVFASVILIITSLIFICYAAVYNYTQKKKKGVNRETDIAVNLRVMHDVMVL